MGLEPGQGPGLVFVTLTIAFGHMPGGQLFGALFFVLLTVAAWTSAISVLEPVVAWLVESAGWGRVKSCLVGGTCAWLLGLGSLLSFNEWAGFRPGGRNFFDWAEFLSTTVLLPLGGVLIAIFAGWQMTRSSSMNEFGTGDSALYRAWAGAHALCCTGRCWDRLRRGDEVRACIIADGGRETQGVFAVYAEADVYARERRRIVSIGVYILDDVSSSI